MIWGDPIVSRGKKQNQGIAARLRKKQFKNYKITKVWLFKFPDFDEKCKNHGTMNLVYAVYGIFYKNKRI